MTETKSTLFADLIARAEGGDIDAAVARTAIVIIHQAMAQQDPLVTFDAVYDQLLGQTLLLGVLRPPAAPPSRA